MAVAPLLLGSCSYVFDVRAVAIGGRLAFVSADGDYDCVANINVSVGPRTAPVAVPAPGDDRGLVVNGGAYWWTDNHPGECALDFPILYGADGPSQRTRVAPKILRVGVPYAVNTQGQGAYGTGCFRITAERRLDNLPSGYCLEPSPDVQGEAEPPVNGAG